MILGMEAPPLHVFAAVVSFAVSSENHLLLFSRFRPGLFDPDHLDRIAAAPLLLLLLPREHGLDGLVLEVPAVQVDTSGGRQPGQGLADL